MPAGCLWAAAAHGLTDTEDAGQTVWALLFGMQLCAVLGEAEPEVGAGLKAN